MPLIGLDRRSFTRGSRLKAFMRALIASVCLLQTPFLASAVAQIRIVTTTPTYADIAGQVGGQRVEVESIMRGPENIHNVVPKPSHMMKLRKADLLLHGGMDAEPWLAPLIKGARRSHLLPGQPGNVDVSQGIEFKEVPTRGQITRALGDIHVYGNVHYGLDPLNGIIIARTITASLKRLDPQHTEEYQSNYEDFARRLRALTDSLTAKLKPYHGTAVVVYHRTWPYFLDRFGLFRAVEIESKPGIAPGPAHLSRCIESMKTRGVKVVITGSYDNQRNAAFVAERGGGVVVQLAQELNAVPGVDTYEQLFQYNVQQLLDTLSRQHAAARR